MSIVHLVSDYGNGVQQKERHIGSVVYIFKPPAKMLIVPNVFRTEQCESYQLSLKIIVGEGSNSVEEAIYALHFWERE